MKTASILCACRSLWPELDDRGLKVRATGPHVTKPVWKGLWRGDDEGPEFLAMSGRMRPADRVLEPDAGLVSGVLAKQMPAAHFTSYEANPALVPVIGDLHRRNAIGNVDLRSAIVAPLAGGKPRPFRLPQHKSSLVAEAADAGVVEVQVHDPAEVMAELRPDVLRCDIEGGEAEPIPALPMGDLRAAVIELHPHILRRVAKRRIFDAFLAAGLVPVAELSTATVVAFERGEAA